MRLSFWVSLGLGIILGLQFLGGVDSAYAHEGINQGQNPLTAWNTNPTPTLLLLIAAYLYVTGLQRWTNPSQPVRLWQRVSFFSGLFAIFLALQSPIDPLAVHLQSFHQAQHLLLRMVGPLLIALGMPLTPTLRGLPPWILQGVVRPAVRNSSLRALYRFLTNPIVATLLFVGVMVFWQIPSVHDTAVRHDPIHEMMHFTMLFSGLLFWWIMVDPKPYHSHLHYGLRILYLGLLIIPNTVLGAAITFSGSLLYQSYAEVEQPYGLSLMADQQLGGLLLWVPAEMMHVIVAGIVMIKWYQSEEAKELSEAAAYEMTRHK